MGLVTQKEYARRRGLTPQYVNKLVRQERIKLKGGLVDPVQADQARAPRYAMTSRPKAQRGSNAHGGGRPARDPGPAEAGAPRPSATMSLTSARAAGAGYQARLLKLEFEKLSGQLLPAAEVLEAERRKNANFRLRLRGLAPSLAPAVNAAATTAECNRLLLEAFEHLLRELEQDPLGTNGTTALPPEPPAAVVQTSAEGAA